jgi:hypothetical protein
VKEYQAGCKTVKTNKQTNKKQNNTQGRDLYRATPALAWGLGFFRLHPKELQNVGLCSMLKAYEQVRIFIVPRDRATPTVKRRLDFSGFDHSKDNLI